MFFLKDVFIQRYRGVIIWILKWRKSKKKEAISETITFLEKFLLQSFAFAHWRIYSEIILVTEINTGNNHESWRKVVRLKLKIKMLRYFLISYCHVKELAANNLRLKLVQPNSHQTPLRLFVWIYSKKNFFWWHSPESFPLSIKVPLKYFHVKLVPKKLSLPTWRKTS